MRLLILSLLCWLLLPWSAWSAGPVLEAINAFRQDPLASIALTGLSAEELHALWPEELWAEVMPGVPPLAADPALDAVAAARAEEILRDGLPLPAGFPEGLDAELEDAGLKPLARHESYAVLAFETALTEDDARRLLLDTLMSGALLRRNGDALLLFPCWTSMGSALVFGEIDVEGELYHAAVLVLVFATGEDAPPMILGRVFGLQADGGFVPLVEAGVGLERWWGDNLHLSTKTWPEGNYCLRPEKDGDFLLQVLAEGWEPRRELVALPEGPYRLDFILSPISGAEPTSSE